MHKLSFSKLLPKGSVLVFSLLILSIMLVTSLTILSSALLNQKASLSTGSSGRSFQVADSGVERVLYQIYKQNNATLEDLGDAIAGGSTATVRCNNGIVSFPVSGGDVKVGFYQDDVSNPGNIISYTNCAGTDWRDKVVKIKSEGTAGTTSRAVEVAVAAGTVKLVSETTCNASTGSETAIGTIIRCSIEPCVTDASTGQTINAIQLVTCSCIKNVFNVWEWQKGGVRCN